MLNSPLLSAQTVPALSNRLMALQVQHEQLEQKQAELLAQHEVSWRGYGCTGTLVVAVGCFSTYGGGAVAQTRHACKHRRCQRFSQSHATLPTAHLCRPMRQPAASAWSWRRLCWRQRMMWKRS